MERPDGVRDLSGLTILFVDDMPDDREIFKLLFEELGARVITAEDVATAMTILSRSPVDVVVSDIGFGSSEDGYRLIERLRSLPPDQGGLMPAIAVTGHSAPEDRAKAIALGFDEHISKPYDPDQVVAAINHLEVLIHRIREFRGASRSGPEPANCSVAPDRGAEQAGGRRMDSLRSEAAQSMVERRIEVLRVASAHAREALCREGLREVRIGAPLRRQDGSEEWLVTAICTDVVLHVEVTVSADGSMAVSESPAEE